MVRMRLEEAVDDDGNEAWDDFLRIDEDEPNFFKRGPFCAGKEDDEEDRQTDQRLQDAEPAPGSDSV